MIPNDTYEALKVILEKLSGSDIDWVLIGSTNLALQGVDLVPNDIDILTDKSGSYKLGNLLKEYETQSVQFVETDKFKSHIGRFSINNIQVEVMGDLQNRIPAEDLWSETNKFEDKIKFKHKDLIVPAISLEREYVAYKKMGREEKAKKIFDVLQSRNIE